MWCPEEEKKEKREEKSMPALFMEINRQYGMRCMQRIREIGIQQGQMPIIMIVYRHNGCSQKEIAEWMGVTPPTVNVSIQRLEKADIVCRKRDDKDQTHHACISDRKRKKNRGGAPAGKQSCGESDVQQFQRSRAMSFTKVFWADSG